jgi:hypothetical protein
MAFMTDTLRTGVAHRSARAQVSGRGRPSGGARG